MNLLPSGATESTLEMLFTVRDRSMVDEATSNTKTARVVPFGMFTPKMYRPSPEVERKLRLAWSSCPVVVVPGIAGVGGTSVSEVKLRASVIWGS